MIYLPIALTVLSSATYHFMLKQASGRFSPFAILFWSYLIAAVVCFVAVLATKAELRITPALQGRMYLPALLALALIGIEVGYLIAYKSGGSVSQVAMVTHLISIVFLLALGYLLLNEPMTIRKVIGVATAGLSLFLLAR